MRPRETETETETKRDSYLGRFKARIEWIGSKTWGWNHRQNSIKQRLKKTRQEHVLGDFNISINKETL